MRFSSMRYLTREGFRSIWQNRFMAIASIGVLVSCLILTGCSYLVYANVNHVFDWVYGQNVVVVFAEEGSTKAQTDALYEEIQTTDNVQSVEFVSKEQLLEKYKNDIPEATYQDMQGEDNPYLDCFIVTFEDLSHFDTTIEKLKAMPDLDSISYNEDIAAQLTNIRNTILIISGCVVGLLLLVSMFIIINTIKLTVYNRRLEISIMKSVGATNAFVRIPFVIEGMVLGATAGLLSFGITYVLYTRLFESFKIGITTLVSFGSVWHILLIGFMGIGILTGMLGSAISMGKYLKKQGGISNVM